MEAVFIHSVQYGVRHMLRIRSVSRVLQLIRLHFSSHSATERFGLNHLEGRLCRVYTQQLQSLLALAVAISFSEREFYDIINGENTI